MGLRRQAAALEHAIALLPRRDLDAAVRHAAWVARYVGRGDATPLAVVSGRWRAVVAVLRPGDIDGDIQPAASSRRDSGGWGWCRVLS